MEGCGDMIILLISSMIRSFEMMLILSRLCRMASRDTGSISKSKLCRKPYGTQHPQRIIGIGYIRIKRCTNDFCLQIGQPVKRIQQLTQSFPC